MRFAERNLRRKARAAAAGIRRAWRGRGEVDVHILGHVVDELRREIELGVADRVVFRRDFERVLAFADQRRVYGELLRLESVCRRPRRGGGYGRDRRAVDARGEAVGVLDE